MRLSLRLLTALFAIALLAPTAQADFTIEDTQTVFLRGTGCGATEALYLSIFQGADEYDGCGTIGGLPFNEAADSGHKTLSLQEQVDLRIDANRDLVVTIRAESWYGDGIPGAGQSTVTVTVRAKEFGANTVKTLGAGSSTATVTGADHHLHVITIDIPEELQLLHVDSLTLDVRVHGANFNVNNLGMEGDSFFDLPILLDDGEGE